MNDGNGAAPKKLWNGKKNRVRLEVSVYGKYNIIHIGKDVQRVIGAPEYVCLKINQGMDSFVVMPCEPDSPLSFRVPDNIMFDWHKQMKISSRSFVIGLLSVNAMDPDRTYRITGIYSEKNNAVVFNMSDIRMFGKGGE